MDRKNQLQYMVLNMCLYPRFIKNKRYLGYNLKRPSQRAANAALCDDFRKLYVPIGCGHCIECKRQKAQSWRMRLQEEIKIHKYAYFTTFTFSNESLIELEKACKSDNVNVIATIAIRRFLERWRKKNKKSLLHWFVTELGHENTERIHIHGIIFNELQINEEEIQDIWKYGRSDLGEYCNAKSINYIVKYILKVDNDHKTFNPIILCSAGIGKCYFDNDFNKFVHRFQEKETKEFYYLENGKKIALPIYLRNKFWTQEERDKLWTQRLDKQVRYVNGIEQPLKTEEDEENYIRLLEEQQKQNEELGYGNADDKWKDETYRVTLNMLKRAQRK